MTKENINITLVSSSEENVESIANRISKRLRTIDPADGPSGNFPAEEASDQFYYAELAIERLSELNDEIAVIKAHLQAKENEMFELHTNVINKLYDNPFREQYNQIRKLTQLHGII